MARRKIADRDHRHRVPTLPLVRPPLTRAKAVTYVAERYAWDPARVDAAILRLVDHFGASNEVFYRDPQNYREVTIVWISRTDDGRYEIREENRPARLAREPVARYTTGVSAKRTVPARKPSPIMEATDMATRGRTKAVPAKAKEPEPEDVEELEDDEAEDLDDEVEDEEDEESEDEEQDDEEDEEGDDEEDDEEDEADEDEAKDYTPYAGKSPTATMEDFGVWLLAEVYEDAYPGDEDSFLEGVRLGGTLRMEFQRSEFCRQRREERKAEAAAARKPAKTKEEPPAKTTKTTAKAPAKTTAAKAAPAKAATATKAAAPAAGKRPVPGKPAGRTADRPAAAKATTTKAATTRRGRGKAAEEPF